MKLSKQMRLLQNKWQTNSNWPQRLDWLAITGVRGWSGQRVEFRFPMVAISGENGSGKSTILQSAAAIYQGGKEHGKFASDFFPDTAWDYIKEANIQYSVRMGDQNPFSGSIRKPTSRWLGNPDRPKRSVRYIDLNRIQPISAKTGYSRLAQPTVREESSTPFAATVIERLTDIMGRKYSTGKMALTEEDKFRQVPVISLNEKNVSGFHQGAGEYTMTEFLQLDPPPYSLVLIDEIETSLHPRAQRRLVRDLANLCRERELQVILTTHSPYVLAEFPPEARGYILTTDGNREVVFGVSPEFAMSKMDEEIYPECDLYVEDPRAAHMIQEILGAHAPDVLSRIQTIPFGAASVGRALGQMVEQKKFPRPSLVFLDGDEEPAPGCLLLPGKDAPEQVVFAGLKAKHFALLDLRLGRDFSQIADAFSRAMTENDHHQWVSSIAKDLRYGSEGLWQIFCATWAANYLTKEQAEKIITPIRELLI